MKKRLILVAGGGGFIGGHLAADLLKRPGAQLRVVDKKPLDDWWQLHPEADNLHLDLACLDACHQALDGAD